jgi:hypothetical protein
MGIEQKRYMKLFLVLLCLTVFISPGCKGKEETQPVSETPISEQQVKEGVTAKQDIPPGTSETSSSESVRNMPPKITSLDLSPRIPVAGDKIKAIVTTFDNEGDTVKITYEWSKDGVMLPEKSDALPVAKDFKRGDKIMLRVIPDDGNRKGNPLSIVITIANAVPVIRLSQEPLRLDGGLYTYQVKATDPDGDELAYALKEAPDGMMIDPKKGFIQWKVPPDMSGTSSHTVSVTDGHGGETIATITLDIQTKHSR